MEEKLKYWRQAMGEKRGKIEEMGIKIPAIPEIEVEGIDVQIRKNETIATSFYRLETLGEDHRIVWQTQRPGTIRQTVLGGPRPHSEANAGTQKVHCSQGRWRTTRRPCLLPSRRAGVRQYGEYEKSTRRSTRDDNSA